MVFGMDGYLGVQYRKICIAAHLDHTFFRVGAHELGRLGRGNLHKRLGAPFADSFAETLTMPRVFNAGQAVGDLGKIVFMAIFLLAGKIGMVAVGSGRSGHGLPSPKLCLVFQIAHRRHAGITARVWAPVHAFIQRKVMCTALNKQRHGLFCLLQWQVPHRKPSDAPRSSVRLYPPPWQ